MTFPYFRVFSPDRGYTVAVGWQGQWCGEVTRGMDGAVRVGARQQTVDFYLKPGERVISPTITVMAFGDHDDAVNAWRRFMRRWILPRAKDGKTPLRPILGINGQESGVLYNTITLDRQVELAKIMRGKGIDYDGWWVDAGWYVPKGATNAQGKAMTWYEGTGLWKPDPARFPPSGFKPLADELAKSGAMLFLWHEPERVHKLSGFMEKAKPYLFPSSDTGMIRRYDMSRPDAVDFISGIVAESIVSNGVAFYRQDSNGPGPLRFWPHADQARGDGRKGIAENFAVQGQFRMWERFRAAKRRAPQRPFDASVPVGAAPLLGHRLLGLPREAALQPHDERMALLPQEHRLGVPSSEVGEVHRQAPRRNRLRADAHDPHRDLPRS